MSCAGSSGSLGAAALLPGLVLCPLLSGGSRRRVRLSVRTVRYRSGIQCFRRHISTVRPDDRATLNEEPGKVARFLQRLKYDSLQPTFEIHSGFHGVVEDEMDPESASMLGSHN